MWFWIFAGCVYRFSFVISNHIRFSLSDMGLIVFFLITEKVGQIFVCS